MRFHDFPNKRKLDFGLIFECEPSLSELMRIDGVQLDKRRSSGVVDLAQCRRCKPTLDLQMKLFRFRRATTCLNSIYNDEI